MQLLLNTTSPFARVARMAALEAGLGARLELRWCDPWQDDPMLLHHHPAGRVPVLLTDTGTSIAESLLIAQYLDAVAVAGPGRLLPARQRERTLHTVSVAYALMEAAFQTVIARKHHGADVEATSVLGRRRQAAVQRCLQALQSAVDVLPATHTPWTLDAITVAVALAYLQLRLPQLAWPAALQNWFDAVQAHPTLVQTAFPAA